MQLFLYFANNYYQFFNVIRNKSLKLDTYINRQKIKSKQSTKLKEEEIEKNNDESICRATSEK